MSAKFEEYSEKYVRSGAKAIASKEDNEFPQMKTNTFRLNSDESFGGLGSLVEWKYVHEPLNMYPGLAVSDKHRYFTILGGSGYNYLDLHGEVEITLGKTREAAQTFSFSESVAVYVEKDMLYNINIKRIDSPEYPIFLNELIYGDFVPADGEVAGAEGSTSDYSRYFASGETIWAKFQPHHEVIYPVIFTGSTLFDSSVPIHRTWMPASIPHTMVDNPHYHEFAEFLSFYGTDPDDISDLGGVVEFTIGETLDDLTMFTIDKSTQFYIKPGLWHCPMTFKEIKDPKKPIVFSEVTFAHSLGGDDGKTVWRDGKVRTPPKKE